MKALSRVIADVPVDAARLQEELASLAPAHRRYAILLVPRSGSTWLAGLLSRQRLYGMPREYLNGNMIRRLAEEMNANTLPDYLGMLVRKRVTDGTFGTKVACQSLAALLNDMEFEAAFAGYRWIYLRRRNAVAQAVSHYKALTSRHPHRRSSDDADRRRLMDEAERRIGYDAAAIEWSMNEALDMELFAERLIAARGLDPLRLYYEDMMASKPVEIVDRVHRLVFGTPRPTKPLRPSMIERSGTALNVDFEERFRRDRPDFLRRYERRRPGMAAPG